MIALLKIQCPHCGAAGQILMPPPGAVIIGPCPECSRLVAIFAGDALPLDDNIMNNTAMKDKYEHVMKVLTVYLEKQVRKCFTQADPAKTAAQSANGEGKTPQGMSQPITDGEMNHFIQSELHEIDNPDFFNDFK